MHKKKADSSITRLNFSEITLDPEIQPRQQLNQEVVAEYAEAMKQGTQFPPVVVYFDGTAYWLADGFHRVEANKTNGKQSISAKVRHGSRHDAKLHSIGPYSTHVQVPRHSEKHSFFESILYDGESEPLQLLDQSPERSRRKGGKDIATKLTGTLTNIS